MANASVEWYEQVLAEDPSSTVFVELGDALIQSGQHARALEVCSQGLNHHPESIIGRILYGKALLYLGRAAEAMDQFEQATAVERQNPQAYVLISEVLLQRGLYRSALPLLKKALALRPSAHVQQWLEEALRVVARGPGSPAVFEPAPVDAEELEAEKRNASSPQWAGDIVPLQNLSPTQGAAVEASPENEVEGAPVVGAQRTMDDGPQTVRRAAHRERLDEEPPSALPLGEGKGDAPSPFPLPSLTPPHLNPFPQGEGVRKPGILDDLPDHPEPAPPVQEPQARVTVQAAEEIAKKYEGHLREQLHQRTEIARKSFLARHWLKLSVATVVAGALTAGILYFLHVRAEHRGRDLQDVLAYSKKAIAQDTRASYLLALRNLALALEMDDESDEAWALAAYTHSVLFAEWGAGGASRAKAEGALERQGVRSKFPGLSLASEYYLADATQREALRRSVLASKSEEPALQELAGRILLAQNDSKAALARFDRVLKADPGNVRSLVALGDYYWTFGDYPTALKFYVGAASTVSPDHPARVVGAAEARLETNVDLQEALAEVTKLPAAGELPAPLVPRRELVQGRLLSATGQLPKAIEKLANGVRIFPSQAFEFNVALADAHRLSGQMELASRALEAALKLRPKSAEAKEALGKILIARDREREVLARFVSESHSQKVSLIRGLALAKSGDWKRARAELANTALNGRFPAEAAIALALADAAEGQPERAQTALEKALASTSKAKGELRVALGKVYWQRGALDKAKAQFEDAAKERDDYEGNCALGRLRLSLGSTAAAIAPLRLAVARNSSHGEAREALGRAYLETGKFGDAVKELEAWQADNPFSKQAPKNLGWALYHAGKLKEAEAALEKAVRLNAADPQAHRIHAMVLFSRGNAKLALAELGRANRLDPKDSETFCEIGHSFYRQGKPEMALKAYQAALRENPESACGKIGLSFARLPDASRASAKELEELSRLPGPVWTRAFASATLARVRLATGAIGEARRAAEEAIALAPFFAQGHLALGLVAARQKDDALAKEELSRAVELEPVDGFARLALADFLVRGEETAKAAVEHYRAFLQIGGSSKDQLRVKHLLPNLKKKLASR